MATMFHTIQLLTTQSSALPAANSIFLMFPQASPPDHQASRRPDTAVSLPRSSRVALYHHPRSSTQSRPSHMHPVRSEKLTSPTPLMNWPSASSTPDCRMSTLTPIAHPVPSAHHCLPGPAGGAHLHHPHSPRSAILPILFAAASATVSLARETVSRLTVAGAAVATETTLSPTASRNQIQMRNIAPHDKPSVVKVSSSDGDNRNTSAGTQIDHNKSILLEATTLCSRFNMTTKLRSNESSLFIFFLFSSGFPLSWKYFEFILWA